MHNLAFVYVCHVALKMDTKDDNKQMLHNVEEPCRMSCSMQGSLMQCKHSSVNKQDDMVASLVHSLATVVYAV